MDRATKRGRKGRRVWRWPQGGRYGIVASSPTAAPRHFLYPALFLLLAEEPATAIAWSTPSCASASAPSYRPSIYRVSRRPRRRRIAPVLVGVTDSAGSTRHVYAVTEAGFAVPSAGWMAVVEKSRPCSPPCMKRYDVVLGGQIIDDPVE